MTLRLAQESTEYEPCPKCAGRGKVPQSQTTCTRTLGRNGMPVLAPGDGYPVPCPACKGSKVRIKGHVTQEKS